ncbi:hypothetical protein FRC03_012253 [Tulasnella sp. 419]|nr:hypothetical protein FRC03_012253 [Tulasnella sp. 419]
MFGRYDVAFQSGREPERRSRTDFLSGNSLNTLHGRGILVNKTGGHGLPVEQLASSAGWSWNIGNSLRQITKSAVPFPEHANDFDTTKFKRFDAKRTGWVDPVEMKREEDARNELVVDLAMSLDVYSMEPFHKDTIRRDVNDSEFVEEATNMLSKTTLRASEPSKIEYGFLRALPINQIPGEELTPIDDRDKEDGSVEPLGVRLLLQEWPLGEDPSNYTYEDPYGPSTQSSISWTQQTANTSSTGRPAGTSSRPFVSSTTGMNSVPVISTSVAAPPKLLDSSMLSNKPVPAVVSKQADRWNSQPNDNPTAFSDQWPESSQSQGRAIPSTQPVPGPFGRRQGFDGKKKPKRVGGF